MWIRYWLLSVYLQSISFARLYPLSPNSMGFAGLYLLPDKTSFSNSPALSPSPYLRKLIHLTIRKNTTPFSPNNPANSPRIKVSAREARRFPHAPSPETYPPTKPPPPDTPASSYTLHPWPASPDYTTHTPPSRLPASLRRP